MRAYTRVTGMTYGPKGEGHYIPVYYHTFKIWFLKVFIAMSSLHTIMNVSLFKWTIISTAWRKQRP